MRRLCRDLPGTDGCMDDENDNRMSNSLERDQDIVDDDNDDDVLFDCTDVLFPLSVFWFQRTLTK